MSYPAVIQAPFALLAGAYVLTSAASFALYAYDKAAARSDGRRIPESTLHLLALAGGWPGAMAGQRAFRHKTVKTSFRLVFWATVAANSMAVLWLLHALA